MKIKTATLMRVLVLVLLGLSAALLPAIGSAQSPAIEAWQEAIKNTQLPELGCFQGDYPNTQWEQVPCEQPRDIIPPWQSETGMGGVQFAAQGPIGGTGYSASAVGGPISSAEGSFINVTGVTNIVDSVVPPYNNTYSLQVNTDYFHIPGSSAICGGNSNGCNGWVQFVYQNYGTSSGYFAAWYWLEGAKSCPSSWIASGSDWCYYYHGLSIAGQPLANFNNQIKLSAQTVNGVDTTILTMGGKIYSVTNPSAIKDLPQLWQQTQFNVFGLGNYAVANFNNGSALTVKTQIDNGTTNAPSCTNGVGTGEANNLNYNSPCCPAGGSKPMIVFAEGTDTNPSKFSCADLGVNTQTYTVTASAGTGGTINPSGAVSVDSGATKAFTVTPNAGYNISSVGGTCGGTLSGNIYTIKPVAANCTVTAAFSTQTYVVTASAGTGGTISPTGYLTVNSGATQSFTVTPNAGYSISSVGGTCGGTLSGSTYMTKPITASCTVTAVFTPATATYTVTASAGAGGTINPSGVISVNSGATQSFTVTPNAGYGISSVGGTCGGTLNGNTYTTKAVTVNCTVTAAFTPVTATYTVTANAGTGGTINPSGAVSVNSGATKAFTVIPNVGYNISSVGGTCGGTLNGNTYTTKAVTANCTVTAAFTPQGNTQFPVQPRELNLL